jgi:hypothetical protein
MGVPKAPRKALNGFIMVLFSMKLNYSEIKSSSENS